MPEKQRTANSLFYK